MHFPFTTGATGSNDGMIARNLTSLILEVVKTAGEMRGTEKLDQKMTEYYTVEFHQSVVEILKQILKEHCICSADVACRTINLVNYCMNRHGKAFQTMVTKTLLQRVHKIAKGDFDTELRSTCATFIRGWANENQDAEHADTTEAVQAAFGKVWAALQKNCILVEQRGHVANQHAPTPTLQLLRQNMTSIEKTGKEAEAGEERLRETSSNLEVFESRARVLTQREMALDAREDAALKREQAVAQAEPIQTDLNNDNLGPRLVVLENRERMVAMRETACKSREYLFKTMKARQFGSGPLPSPESDSGSAFFTGQGGRGVFDAHGGLSAPAAAGTDAPSSISSSAACSRLSSGREVPRSRAVEGVMVASRSSKDEAEVEAVGRGAAGRSLFEALSGAEAASEFTARAQER
eukprot:2049342-Rhodomonas_salina.1